MITVKWTYKNGTEYSFSTNSIIDAAELYGLKSVSAGVVNVKMFVDGMLTIEYENNSEKR